jgi:hypothetical protein
MPRSNEKSDSAEIASLSNIGLKLDKLLEQDDMHIFDKKEIETLQSIIEAWRAASGWIKVTKNIGVVIAFVVVLWTQWDRLVELISGLLTGSKP